MDVDDDVVWVEEEDELEDVVCELDELMDETEVDDEIEEVEEEEDEEEGEVVEVDTLEVVVVVVVEELVAVAR